MADDVVLVIELADRRLLDVTERTWLMSERAGKGVHMTGDAGATPTPNERAGPSLGPTHPAET
jgi:hypothetical protein